MSALTDVLGEYVKPLHAEAAIVFDWKDHSNWSARLRSTFASEIPANLLHLVATSDVVLADDLAWLDELRAAAGMKTGGDLIAIFADRFHSAFRAVRTYHGCCPRDAESYRSCGFRIASVGDMLNQALLEIKSLNPNISEERVRRAHDQVHPEIRAGRAHFVLDDRFLTKYCAHYLIYGSEYLLGVATQLSDKEMDLPRALRDKGVPTVFVCDIPVRIIDYSTIENLCRLAIGELFRKNRERDNVMPELDFTITLEEPVPPTVISDHYHPALLEDPIRSREAYIPKRQSCALCQ